MPRNTESDPGGRSPWVILAQYSGLVLLLPAAVLVGYWLGEALDHALHSGRLWTVIGTLLGAAAGIYQLLRELLRTK